MSSKDALVIAKWMIKRGYVRLVGDSEMTIQKETPTKVTAKNQTDANKKTTVVYKEEPEEEEPPSESDSDEEYQEVSPKKRTRHSAD